MLTKEEADYFENNIFTEENGKKEFYGHRLDESSPNFRRNILILNKIIDETIDLIMMKYRFPGEELTPDLTH
ncbi:MAG: hypothetical protein U1E78_09775 [Gammaproteobacteria bacterium]